MKFLLATALLLTAVAGMPDGAGWNKNAPAPHAHPQPSNVQYGPWVSQPTQYRQQKGFASLLPGLGGLRNLADFWSWDKQAVFDGIFKNDNIMIHVGQNFFNFIFTTLAWFFISQIYSSGLVRAAPRSGKSISFAEAADEVLDAIKDFEKKHEHEE